MEKRLKKGFPVPVLPFFFFGEPKKMLDTVDVKLASSFD